MKHPELNGVDALSARRSDIMCNPRRVRRLLVGSAIGSTEDSRDLQGQSYSLGATRIISSILIINTAFFSSCSRGVR
jgi:hypothetical protein